MLFACLAKIIWKIKSSREIYHILPNKYIPTVGSRRREAQARDSISEYYQLHAADFFPFPLGGERFPPCFATASIFHFFLSTIEKRIALVHNQIIMQVALIYIIQWSQCVFYLLSDFRIPFLRIFFFLRPHLSTWLKKSLCINIRI